MRVVTVGRLGKINKKYKMTNGGIDSILKFGNALTLTLSAVFAVGVFWQNTAAATAFQIDDFSIVRNGSLWFQDSFSDGDPNNPNWVFPNGNAAGYETQLVPLTGTEANGKFTFDPFDGANTTSSLNGDPIMVQRARLLTNTSNNPADLNRGLKVDDSFTVTGLFDLIAPTQVGERFGIRLSDRGTINGTGDDVVEVDLRLKSSGLFVEFRERNNALSQHNLLDAIALNAASFGLTDSEFSMFDQIALILNRADSSSNITGAFQLIDVEGLMASVDFNFSGSSAIFEGELFTRAEFLALANLAQAQVPLPATVLLLLTGVGLLGFIRKV